MTKIRSRSPRALILWGAAAAAAALPGLAVLGGGDGAPARSAAVRSAGGPPAAPELSGAARACAGCHPRETAEWSASAHRYSGLDNPWYRAVLEEARREAGEEAASWCGACHTPEPSAAEGVSCVACHAARVDGTAGNGSFELELPAGHRLAAGGPLGRSLHALRVRLDPEGHRRSYSGHRQGAELCAACHKGQLDGDLAGGRFFPLHNDYDPWQGSRYSGQGTVRSVDAPEPVDCAGCHMRPAPGGGSAGGAGAGGASHRFAAANTALPALRGDAEQLAAVESYLSSGWVSLDLFAMTPGRAPLPPGEEPPVDLVEPVLAPLDRLPATARRGESIRIDLVVRPHGVGHLFPGGKPDLHDLWIELEAVDGGGRTIFRSGREEAADGAHVFGTVWVDAEGRRVDHHRAWRARAAAYERRIEPTGTEVVRFRLDLPADAADPVVLRARLRHRKFPPELTRWALAAVGREPPRLPVVTLAEAEATLRLVDPGAPLPDMSAPALELPGDDRRWTHYGVGLALQGDLRGAAEAFRTVISLTPEDPEAWATLGRLLVVAGTFEEGRQALRRALELAPGLARAHHFLGLAARNEADLDGALEHFRAAAAGYPRDPLILRQLATTQLQAGDFAAAAATLETLLAVDSHDALAHFNLAKAARGLGEPERAARHQTLFERYQVDETAQQHVLRYLAEHPEDNLERQRIHEHRSLPLDDGDGGDGGDADAGRPGGGGGA